MVEFMPADSRYNSVINKVKHNRILQLLLVLPNQSLAAHSVLVGRIPLLLVQADSIH